MTTTRVCWCNGTVWIARYNHYGRSRIDCIGYWLALSVLNHYSDVIMGVKASQINDFSIVYSTVCSGADCRKHQSSASLIFMRGIHRWPVNSPHKGPVTQKMFLFDVIMKQDKTKTWYFCIFFNRFSILRRRWYVKSFSLENILIYST